MYEVNAIRQDFPILHQQVNGKPLVYLDSGASSQKPLAVIEGMDQYYRAYETARKKVGRFINARSWREVIFTRNATESINLVAFTWGQANIKAGDVILTSEMEHHANMVPWQQLAKRTGAIVMGTITPIGTIVQKAHAIGALVLLDGAQAVPHMPTNVQAFDCDFLAFSGHKMLGPTGIGVLWARKEILADMPPFMTGGDMISRVTFEGAEWNELPWKFEAGTPAIAEAIGLGIAVDYLTKLGMHNVRRHEIELTSYAFDRLGQVEGIRVYGPPDPTARGGAIAFSLGDIHPHDVAAVLDGEGIAVRAGHHCAMPLHDKLGLTATTRASFYVYNLPAEIDRLAEGLDKVRELLG